MAKLILNDVTNGFSAAIRINANSDAIEAAVENTLSRDGTGPNQMESILDMNSYQIKNLGSPTNATDAARLVDITGLIELTGFPIPSVVGNANKLLFTDGTGIFWGDLPLAALPLFTSLLKGAVPASGGNAAHVLHADGTWHTPAYPTNFQSQIQFENEGVALGATGTVNNIDFVGDLITVARVGNTLTVEVNSEAGEDDPDEYTFTSNECNVNVFQRMGSPVGAGPFTVTLPAGIRIFSLASSVPALDFTGFAPGAVVNFINLGHVMGHGGRGGNGGNLSRVGDSDYGWSGEPGEPGGSALRGPGSGVTFNITNVQGFIWGGGGGGGGGGTSADDGNNIANGGGGGGGAGGGAGGHGAQVKYSEGITASAGSSGTIGSFANTAANGTGGAGAIVGSCTAGTGGNGGDWGANGSPGGTPTANDVDVSAGGGGTAGLAVDQAGGTASFVNGGTAPNVKGGIT